MTLGQLTNLLVPASTTSKVLILSVQEAEAAGHHLQEYVDEEVEDEEEEEEDDPDYAPPDESDEGYRTTSSVTSVESPRMVTGTLGEATEDEHGNLMWLVDFKLDFLSDIDKEPEQNNNNSNNSSEAEEAVEPERKRPRVEAAVPESRCAPAPALRPPTIRDPTVLHSLPHPLAAPPPAPAPAVTKPNYTYTDLITLALRDKTALTVSGIYQWIRWLQPSRDPTLHWRL